MPSIFDRLKKFGTSAVTKATSIVAPGISAGISIADRIYDTVKKKEEEEKKKKPKRKTYIQPPVYGPQRPIAPTPSQRFTRDAPLPEAYRTSSLAIAPEGAPDTLKIAKAALIEEPARLATGFARDVLSAPRVLRGGEGAQPFTPEGRVQRFLLGEEEVQRPGQFGVDIGKIITERFEFSGRQIILNHEFFSKDLAAF